MGCFHGRGRLRRGGLPASPVPRLARNLCPDHEIVASRRLSKRRHIAGDASCMAREGAIARSSRHDDVGCDPCIAVALRRNDNERRRPGPRWQSATVRASREGRVASEARGSGRRPSDPPGPDAVRHRPQARRQPLRRFRRRPRDLPGVSASGSAAVSATDMTSSETFVPSGAPAGSGVGVETSAASVPPARSRWATASNNRIEPATAALREPIAPRIGMRTSKSQRRRIAGPRP